MFLVSCIPAETPPQLHATPGASVVVAGSTVESRAFRVTYPPNWRVITSPADAPPFVIFAAPDNCALVMISAEKIDTLPQPSACEPTGFRSEQRTVDIGGTTITAAGVAPADQWDSFLPVFERVVASTMLPTPDK